MRIGWLLLILGVSIGCQTPSRDAARTPLNEAAWAGVYASGSGEGDGPASLLSIRWVTLPGERVPRPIYRLYANVGAAGRIDVVGAAHIEGDRLTFAIASALLDDDGDSHAIATIERYRFRRVDGRAVLIREEAIAGGGRSPDDVLLKVASDPTALDATPPADAFTIARRVRR